MSRSPFSLEGRQVIVTGAASGMGRCITEVFSTAGATVIACDVAPIGWEVPAGTRTVVGDLAEEATVEAAVAAADDGVLSAVVHCAGIFDGPDTADDIELWQRVLDVNLTSGLFLLKHAAPRIAEAGGGAVVLIGSVSGLNGGYNAGPGYAASKAGVHGLAKWAAKRYAKDNIRVNAIAPGTIRTPMSDRDGAGEEAARRTLLGRRGEPTDIANAALYLVSDAGNFVTGVVHVVDGGLTV